MTLDSFDNLDYYREHFMDPSVWASHVAAVCARHGFPGAPMRPGLAGTYPTFIVAERWVVKFFGRLFDGAQAHAVEQAAGQLLRGWQSLPVAQIVAEGALREAHGMPNPGQAWHWPYLIYTFLPGTSIGAVYDQILPGEKLRLAGELGRVVRSLHDLPLPAEGPLRQDWTPFREFLAGHSANCAARLAEWNALPPHLLAQVEEFLPPFKDLIDESSPPRFLHGDLTRDHLLGEEHDGCWRTSGWIDFGDARAGNPYYEWVALHLDLFGGDRDLLRAFMSAYGLPQSEWAAFPRLALAYTLIFQFNVIGWHLNLKPELRQVETLDQLAQRIWGISV